MPKLKIEDPGICIGVIYKDEKGKLVVGIEPDPRPFKHDEEVKLSIIIKINGKYYWKNDSYKRDNIEINKLSDSTSTINIAPNTINNVCVNIIKSGLVTWRKIFPCMQHKYNKCNDPYKTSDRYYTNVYIADYPAHGVKEGDWLGNHGMFSMVDGSDKYDIIEYKFTTLKEKSKDWEITPDKTKGVFRYSASIYYNKKEISTPGKPAVEKNEDIEAISGLLKDDYERGISEKVTRIIRLGNNDNDYLSVIEAFWNVPWIYGSGPDGGNPKRHQTERLVGFDCADLIVGAARLAKKTSCGYVGAHELAMGSEDRSKKKAITKWRYDNTLYLKYGTIMNTGLKRAIKDRDKKPDKDDKEVKLVFGKDIYIGDLILFQWQWERKTTFTHTTAIYSKGSKGFLSPDTKLIYAHWTSPDKVDAKNSGSISITDLKSLAENRGIYFRISRW